jgi:NADH-quinone oxidoreductase subunit L
MLGFGLGLFLYRNKEEEPIDAAIVRRRFYFDEFYFGLIDWTQELLSRVSAFFDRWIIDAGAIRGASGATWGVGALLRFLQVGNLQAYSFLFGLGIVSLIYFAVFR